jgi:hypothetical protein
MTGSSDVNIPPPSAEEKALQAEQTDLLRQQRDIIGEQSRVQKLLDPFLFESAGVKPIFDDAGKVIAFDKIEDPNEALREKIETGFLERTEQALAGELPVNPALLRDLDTQQQAVEERLRRQLGPGYETSTPGQQALQKTLESRNVLLEGARRGDLTLAEQLGLAREQSNEQRINSFLSRTLGVNQAQSPFASGFGQVASGFNQPISSFQNQRNLQTQGAFFNQQNAGSGLFGTLAGAAVGGFAGAGGTAAGSALFGTPPSDKRLKEDIEYYDTWGDIVFYTFKYIGSTIERIGVMAQDLIGTRHEHAVITGEDGYYRVDYSELGL